MSTLTSEKGLVEQVQITRVSLFTGDHVIYSHASVNMAAAVRFLGRWHLDNNNERRKNSSEKISRSVLIYFFTINGLDKKGSIQCTWVALRYVLFSQSIIYIMNYNNRVCVCVYVCMFFIPPISVVVCVFSCCCCPPSLFFYFLLFRQDNPCI